MSVYLREPEYLLTMRDGTVKQVNPFTGTQVWTVAGRGNRPIRTPQLDAAPVDAADHGRYCAFCERRYFDTPPEKARVVRGEGDAWHMLREVAADEVNATVAEFRRIPNLFEILSYDYWHANYGYELPANVRARESAYLGSPVGYDHVRRIIATKLLAMGRSQTDIDALGADEFAALSAGLFGGGHDVIVARRHFVDGATDTTQLASSGTLTPDEHEQFMALTVDAVRDLFETNRYARYVAVFQNWLRPAGASFDHLHKQLAAIDERGVQHELAQQRLRDNPNIYNEDAANYAAYKNLVIAESDYALAFAGFGHRYPTIEVYSKSDACNPWDHDAEELRGMSDMIHAMHAATGVDVPSNEEWHYRPIDSDLPMPWRVMLKWRVSTVAGFEGATKIYLNTLDPYMVRDRVVSALFALRRQGRIAPIRIATECACRPNPLKYRANRPGLFT